MASEELQSRTGSLLEQKALRFQNADSSSIVCLSVYEWAYVSLFSVFWGYLASKSSGTTKEDLPYFLTFKLEIF